MALLALPATGAAQATAPEPDATLAGTADIRPLYDSFKAWIVAAANQVGDADYAFKPTPDVRSFGQLVGHVANANYLFCSTAAGEASPSKRDIEKEVTTKAQLTIELAAAFAYCDKAYQLGDAALAQPAELFGMKGTRLWVLNFNAVHNAEHYGNIVTYMRMKGMVPPSSQRGM
jgi:uncharacterized damage-inducible protein DinB